MHWKLADLACDIAISQSFAMLWEAEFPRTGIKTLKSKPALVEIAKSSTFLGHMPPEIADSLIASGTWNTAKPGELIFEEGEEATRVLVVVAGLLKLARTTRSGTEAVIAVTKPGDGIAVPLAFSRTTYPVSCTALEPSRYLLLRNDVIRQMLLGSPEVMGAVLAETYSHLHHLVEQVEQLKSNTSPKRVARFLLMQSKTSKGSANFRLPYDKVVIAGVLGITPETLSRAFAKLRALGVEIDGVQVAIADVGDLQNFLESGSGQH